MRNLILASVALAASLAAYPAAAGNVKFSLTRSDFDGALTWVLPQSPTPDDWDDVSFTILGPVPGVAHDGGGDLAALFLGFTFYTEENLGGFNGFAVIDPDNDFPDFVNLDLLGDQLFTGSPDMPTFKLGVFHLTENEGDCGCDSFSAQAVTDYTLTISDGVPEPATWALMLGGFGLAGVALRRRRAIAA